MNIYEVAVFVIYIVVMMGFGVYFFRKSKGGEKEYYLGSRELGPWVTALSAGTSDMSAWVLMGLPGAVYWFGLSHAWIAIGLALGYILSWVFVAPRLRQFSIVADDAITLPQFFTNRFKTKSKLLQCICAGVFVVAFAAYTIAHIVVCGVLLNLVFGMDETTGMILGAVLIIAYTFLGGYKGVSWSDFFQGLLMLIALMAAPVFALMAIHPAAFAAAVLPEYYWSFLFTGFFDWESWANIFTGLGWGLGYFGMPHIIVRYMSIRKQEEVKKAAGVAITWNLLILSASVVAGILGRIYFGDSLGPPGYYGTPGGVAGISGGEIVFIELARTIFPTIIAGVLLSAILASAMSSTDSKLLVSSSAFTADVYKPIFRKNASEKEMIWVGRSVVVAVAVVATIIATSPGRVTIMELVGNAWGILGAAFGPAILLSLYWKRFNLAGATAGIVSGAIVAVIWLAVPALLGTGLFGIVPAFAIGLFSSVIVTVATKKPSIEVEEMFDRALALKD